MNSITIIGRLTKAPEKVSLKGGEMSVANFSVAVKNRRKGDEATFFNCKAFGKTADLICKYCDKGSQVAINGSMTSRKYIKDGITREAWELNVETVELLGGKGFATDEPHNSSPATSPIDQLPEVPDDEAMPF